MYAIWLKISKPLLMIENDWIKIMADKSFATRFDLKSLRLIKKKSLVAKLISQSKSRESFNDSQCNKYKLHRIDEFDYCFSLNARIIF